MTRRMLPVGVLMVVAGCSLLLVPAPAGAATVTKVGWWYRTSDPRSAVPRQADSPLLPDPDGRPIAPPQPEGNLVVEGTPGGSTAIAAITYLLTDREVSPVLTIVPDEGSHVPSDALVLACRAAVDWVAPSSNPGRWQDKPLVDCSRSVNGVVGADGRIVFALQPVVSGPDLDVVLVPGVVAEAGGSKVGSTFSLSFDARDDARIVTRRLATSEQVNRAPAVVGGSTPFAAPSGPALAPVLPAAEPALEPQEQAPTVPDVVASAPVPVSDESSGDRAVAVVILLTGVAVIVLARLAAVHAEHAPLSPRGLLGIVPARGTAGAPVTGGLGRFARPRTGTPASLS